MSDKNLIYFVTRRIKIVFTDANDEEFAINMSNISEDASYEDLNKFTKMIETVLGPDNALFDSYLDIVTKECAY